MTWMIYGANGYTGELLARLAVASGERPVLAGRSETVAELASELGLDHRIFAIENPDLSGIDVVAHCAGPFSRTSRPMVDACLAGGVGYVDLTGEIEVFEAIYARHHEAVAAGVALVPGVGFDVVPTDYLLAKLHAQFPGASDAEVALVSRGGFSAGTLRTVIEGVRTGGTVRQDGLLTSVPTGHRQRLVRLGDKQAMVVSAPLGDVSSGHRTTAIPNITTYTNAPGGRMLTWGEPIARWFLRRDRLHRAVDRIVSRTLSGPSAERRAATRSDLWAELSNGTTRLSTAIRVPNTYDFTAHSTLHAVRQMLEGNVPPGSWSPSQAFGTDFLRTIPAIEVADLDTGVPLAT